MAIDENKKTKLEKHLNIIFDRFNECQIRRIIGLEIIDFIISNPKNEFNFILTRVLSDIIFYLIVTIVEVIPLNGDDQDDDVSLFKCVNYGLKNKSDIFDDSENSQNKLKSLKEMGVLSFVWRKNTSTNFPYFKQIKNKMVSHLTTKIIQKDVKPLFDNLLYLENQFFFNYKRYFGIENIEEYSTKNIINLLNKLK